MNTRLCELRSGWYIMYFSSGFARYVVENPSRLLSYITCIQRKCGQTIEIDGAVQSFSRIFLPPFPSLRAVCVFATTSSTDMFSSRSSFVSFLPVRGWNSGGGGGLVSLLGYRWVHIRQAYDITVPGLMRPVHLRSRMYKRSWVY